MFLTAPSYTTKKILASPSSTSEKVRMVDAPIVESAVAASVSAMCGSDLATILEEIEDTKQTAKF